MVPQREKQRMKRLLSEAINVLCKASLPYRSKFTVEGLLGITLDEEEILLINIDELVESTKSAAADSSDSRSADQVRSKMTPSPSGKRGSGTDSRPRKRYRAAAPLESTPIKIEPEANSDSEDASVSSDIQSRPISRINTLKSRNAPSKSPSTSDHSDMGPSTSGLNSDGSVLGSGMVMPLTGLAEGTLPPGVMPETGRVVDPSMWPPSGWQPSGEHEANDEEHDNGPPKGTPIKLENLEQTLQASNNSGQ